jgi:hypothetical protein
MSSWTPEMYAFSDYLSTLDAFSTPVIPATLEHYPFIVRWEECDCRNGEWVVTFFMPITAAGHTQLISDKLKNLTEQVIKAVGKRNRNTPPTPWDEFLGK